MDNNKGLKVLFYLSALVIGFLLGFRGCANGKIVNPKGDTTSVKIETHTDTIWAKDTIYSFKPKYIFLPSDSVITRDTICTNYIKFYSDSLADTNLTIYIKDSIQGLKKYQKLDYKLKIPIKIETTLTKTITIEKYNEPKFTIYGGIESGGNQNIVELSPFIAINRKNLVYITRYDIINKTYSIGLGIRLLQK